MKKLTVRQFAAVKRTAATVNPLIIKRDKLAEKIKALQEEKEEIEREISGHETGITILTGGYTSENLVQKVVESTDKTDKEGNTIKITKYLPTDLVSYNAEENCYYINDVQIVAEHLESIEVPPTEEMPGSDFDIDSNNL